MSALSHPRSIATDRAPAAIGPYAQAVVGGGLVFCSGQIGLDPATGEIVPGGVAAETEQVLRNLGAVNAVYARLLGDARPARATVGVAALPKGARVEIDAIAVV